MSTTTANPGTLTIQLDRLFVPENVRELDEEWVAQLQLSITARGKVTEAIKVIDADPAMHGDEYDYVLVAGFHRTEAACRLGHETIPGVHGDPEHEHTDRAVENIMHKKLNPYEQAVAIRRSLDEGKSAKQAGDLLGMSQNLVTRRVKLLELPDTAQRLVGDGTVSLESVEPMRVIAQANPALLDAAIDFIAECSEEIAPDDFVYQPLSILTAAVEATDREVFVAPLSVIPLKSDLLSDDDHDGAHRPRPRAAQADQSLQLQRSEHPLHRSRDRPCARSRRAARVRRGEPARHRPRRLSGPLSHRHRRRR